MFEMLTIIAVSIAIYTLYSFYVKAHPVNTLVLWVVMAVVLDNGYVALAATIAAAVLVAVLYTVRMFRATRRAIRYSL